MNAKIRKYIRKRNKIASKIAEIKIVYENDFVYVETNPEHIDALNAAEKIMQCFGMNKPKELSDAETLGFKCLI